jgi:ubiquinone/menaquinone biosynthesis C-methylase UbiE
VESDGRSFQLFLEVYGTLPRAGPGGDEHTERALGLVPGPEPQTVLDLGCGPGPQTVALARSLPNARLVAVDKHVSMVDEATRRVVDGGFDDRVEVVVGDMMDPPVDDHSQDLIWSEGAIYNAGVVEGLERWRPLLKPGGAVAFTEVVWLVDQPPAEVADWWTAQYPAISDRAGVAAKVAAAGYRTVDSFVLPASAWRDEYYDPMQDRIDGLRQRLPDDQVALDIAAEAEAEIDYHRRFSDCYSYEFFVVQPAG